MNRNAIAIRGFCRATNIKAIPSPTASARTRCRTTSARSRLPNACDVSPLVPIRRKPKIQYIMLNSIPPTAMAPIYEADPKCPTIATSTSPSSGTVMFETIEGRAMFNMRLFIALVFNSKKGGI